LTTLGGDAMCVAELGENCLEKAICGPGEQCNSIWMRQKQKVIFECRKRCSDKKPCDPGQFCSGRLCYAECRSADECRSDEWCELIGSIQRRGCSKRP
jgi:hypothetical protein